MSLERFSLSGRTALVTGGAKGIGFAICEALRDAGADLVIADYDAAAGADAAARLGAGFEQLDVTDHAACMRLAERIAPEIVVANAGIVHNAETVVLDPADWQRVIDVNLTGVFNTMRAFGPEMVRRGRGAAVCTSSICGEVPVVPQPQVAYNAAKAGVNLIVKSLAVEWAQSGVRINAVAPGYTATELTLAGRSKPEWFDVWMDRTPMGRLGEPREIADAVHFLVSDAASYITGTVLAVDGGYTAV
ncbi:SDR family NAD(P)-dependent oxidoreductase [Paracoccus alkanivorans]|uniref:SDR family NAD(P)-dependent oxidoreductase n=1 Tax=Paracoccus alkanivorans TaxID=2116655 RepID=A0A3M0MJM1_9RHOB|nr:SDR family oxidoreductase [Paracoccus alkanivorans]RMC37962.1 SDR family NAD(P)-dependent oxidoreductase [Paracoccus alkanivorans]